MRKLIIKCEAPPKKKAKGPAEAAPPPPKITAGQIFVAERFVGWQEAVLRALQVNGGGGKGLSAGSTEGGDGSCGAFIFVNYLTCALCDFLETGTCFWTCRSTEATFLMLSLCVPASALHLVSCPLSRFHSQSMMRHPTALQPTPLLQSWRPSRALLLAAALAAVLLLAAMAAAVAAAA